MPRRLLPLFVAAIALVGCRGGDPSPKPSNASVERAVREWVRSAQGPDARDFCSRTFMLYDTASSLWTRLEFVDPPDTPPPPPQPTASAARVRRDCFDEFVFEGKFQGALFSGTRVLAIRRIHVDAPVHHAGSIRRTAVAEVTTQHHSQPPVTGRMHLILYGGRWRVTLRNG
jgi:hypothetical protein